jgi:hypothetical protein
LWPDQEKPLYFHSSIERGALRIELERIITGQIMILYP